MLERVNPLQVIGLRSGKKKSDWVPGFAKAVLSLAKRKIGALITSLPPGKMAEVGRAVRFALDV